MKRHQIAAIVIGSILSLVTFIPVLLTKNAGYELTHYLVAGVFLYPTIGVSVAAVIIFIAFLINKDE